MAPVADFSTTDEINWLSYENFSKKAVFDENIAAAQHFSSLAFEAMNPAEGGMIDLDSNLYYSTMSADAHAAAYATEYGKMTRLLSGEGPNGEEIWSPGYVVAYMNLHNEFEDHIDDFVPLIQRVYDEFHANDGIVVVDGKTVNFDSFGLTPFFSKAINFNPRDFDFSTPQAIGFLHYTRNLLNVTNQTTSPGVIQYLDVIKNADEYLRLPEKLSAFHRINDLASVTLGNTHNVKWTSEDGLAEFVFSGLNFTLNTDVINGGSYNFGPAISLDSSGLTHAQLDVFPWIAFGNMYGDTTSVDSRNGDGAESILAEHITYVLDITRATILENIVLNDEDNVVGFLSDTRFILEGFGGDDLFYSGEQDDIYDGGEGSDTVSYIYSEQGISVNLQLGQGYDGYAAYDDKPEQLISIENIIGSNHIDVIVGGAQDNKLEGLGGNDSIAGEDGSDTLVGGAGNDYLEGGRGSDILFGGYGTDTAAYSGNHNRYTMSFNSDGSISVASSNVDELGTDRLHSIEKLTFANASVGIKSEDTPELLTVGTKNLLTDSGYSGTIRTTVLSDGTSALFWKTHDGNRLDGFDIVYQDADENPTSKISIAKQEYTYDGVVLGNGNFVQIGANYEAEKESYKLIGQLYSNSGEPIGDTFSVHPSDDGDRFEVNVSSTPSGGFAVTWMNSHSTGMSLNAQFFDQDAQKIGLNMELADSYYGNFNSNIITFEDGSFVTLYISYNSGAFGRDQVFCQYFDQTGAAIWDSPIEIYYDGRHPILPSQSLDAVQLSGGRLALSTTQGGIQVVDETGQFIGLSTNSDAAESFRGTSLELLPDGNFIAVGRSYDQDGEGIFLSIFDPEGEPVFEAERLMSGLTSDWATPQVVILPDGDIQVIWKEEGSTGQAVVSRIFSYSGSEKFIDVTKLDASDAYSWGSYSDTFNETGDLLSRAVQYDDGRLAITEYSNNVKATSIVTDISDSHSWDSYTQSFDVIGLRASEHLIFDDGRELYTIFNSGVRVASEAYDIEGVHSWDYLKTTFNSDGNRSQKVADYDDGRKLVTDYDAGIRSSSTITDTANAHAWSTIESTFLSDGENLERKTQTYDDGRTQVADYVGGDKISQTMTDVEDAHNWESFTDIFYDDSFVFLATPVERTQIYDDGRELVIDYVGGVRSQSVMTDVDDINSWDSYTIDYDADGHKVSRTMIYDDGREVFTSYLDDLALLN